MALPAALLGDQCAGDSDHRGDVDVVAAGVHDADFLTRRVLCLYSTGVGDAGFLDDGKRVEIGADEQRRAVAVLEDGDDSEGLAAVGIFADVFGDGVAGFAQLFGEQRRCVFLVVRELGVGMDSLVGVDEAGELGVDEGGDVLCEDGHAGYAKQRQGETERS
jgi:hypothetical protein